LKIRYTGPAARQFDAILAYINARSPDGAANVLSRIDEALSIAAERPRIGQLTSRPGFRRIVINPYPYVILYRAGAEEIVVHSVRHAARKPKGR
jgi:toxin ParE1/3/4